MLVLLAVAGMAQLNPGDPPGTEPGMISFPWHVLENRTGGFGYRDETRVRFYRVAPGHPPTETLPYWMVHVRHDISGVPGLQVQIDRWLDGRSCPAVAQALEALPQTPFEPYQATDIQSWGPLLQPHETAATYITFGRMGGVEAQSTVVDRQNGVVYRATVQARDLLLTCRESGGRL